MYKLRPWQILKSFFHWCPSESAFYIQDQELCDQAYRYIISIHTALEFAHFTTNTGLASPALFFFTVIDNDYLKNQMLNQKIL